MRLRIFLFEALKRDPVIFSGQRFKESDHVTDLTLTEFFAKLDGCHRSHGFFKGCGGSIVEVRRRHFDLAQIRHLEDMSIGFIVGDVKAAIIDFSERGASFSEIVLTGS